jgi:hypothetical protein
MNTFFLLESELQVNWKSLILYIILYFYIYLFNFFIFYFF